MRQGDCVHLSVVEVLRLSANMSVTTKKKHVAKEVMEEYPLPEGTKQVVKVTAARGNNLHEVVTAAGETYLVSMPSKFRKHIWIKRGDFIIVEPIEEGDKVKAEITHILFKDQIKHIQKNNMWPEAFLEKQEPQTNEMIPQDFLPPSDSEDSDEELGDLVINLNRIEVLDKKFESEVILDEDEEEEKHIENVEEDEDSENTDVSESQAILHGKDMTSSDDVVARGEMDDTCLEAT